MFNFFIKKEKYWYILNQSKLEFIRVIGKVLDKRVDWDSQKGGGKILICGGKKYFFIGKNKIIINRNIEGCWEILS
jgi:hypothetical protein